MKVQAVCRTAFPTMMDGESRINLKNMKETRHRIPESITLIKSLVANVVK